MLGLRGAPYIGPMPALRVGRLRVLDTLDSRQRTATRDSTKSDRAAAEPPYALVNWRGRCRGFGCSPAMDAAPSGAALYVRPEAKVIGAPRQIVCRPVVHNGEDSYEITARFHLGRLFEGIICPRGLAI